jgi:hypothetical protein
MRKRIANSFKVNPVSGLIGTVGSIVPRSKVSLGPLLRYMFRVIEDYSFCLVNNQSFALVNVTNINSHNSVGYSDLDKGCHGLNMFRGTTLSFTFSLVPRPVTTLQPLSPVLSLKNRDFTWGRPFKGSEYLTINLSAAQLRDMGIDDYLFDDLLFMYNNVGLATKAFVLNPFGVYSSIEYATMNPVYMKSVYFNKPVSSLFKEPIGYWKYNLGIWQKYNHLLFPEMFKDNRDSFYLYFVQHLMPRLSVTTYQDLRWLTAERKDSLYDFLYSGLLKLMQTLGQPFTHKVNAISDLNKSKDLCAVVHMLYTLSGFDYGLPDDIQELNEFLGQLSYQLTNDGTKRSMFNGMLANLRSMCYDLINSSPQIEVIMEEVLDATSTNT